MKIAIVTGASSGLGRVYVKQLDRQEKLDEIWAIARREDRLEALKAETGTPVRVLAYDLTAPASIDALEALLQREAPEVRVLINAAGFGKIGSWRDISRADCDNMILLNCRAAVDVTQLCLPYMKRGARIMEICSTAAFQPFPYVNVYAASKAFLYRYTRALRLELLGRGIRVTAVCPYWIRDTEFIGTAQKTQNCSYVRHFPLASHERTVAGISTAVSRAGLPVATPGIMCTLHRVAAKFIPSELMMGIWALLRRV